MAIGARILYNQLKSQLLSSIEHDYSAQEVKNTLGWLLEYTLDLTQTDILINKEIAVTADQHRQLQSYIKRINQEEPIQYILSECEFYGREFTVTPHVLIPRPETEELVHLIIQQHTQKTNLRILDIGTGSGCIAITLNKEIPKSNVWAVDISADALAVAQLNALNLQSLTKFVEMNILVDSPEIEKLDMIVSNPPYVLNSDKADMRQNVLNYEPPAALFVEDSDPLLFYRRISELCTQQLSNVKWVYLEVHEKFAAEVKKLLAVSGFPEVNIVKDSQGKDRFVVAHRQKTA